MRNRPHAQRGLGPAAMLMLVLTLLLVGVGGTLGTLVALGHIEAPWAAPSEAPAARAAAPIDRKGQTAFLVLGRSLKAYSKVARDDVADPKSGLPAVVWVRTEEIDPNWLRNPADIVGRVLVRDKGPFTVLTEKDFFPKGTREGVTAGVPHGKMALVVHAAAVPTPTPSGGTPNAAPPRPGGIRGLHVLKAGDRFDLLAAVPLDLQKELPQIQLGLGNDALAGRDETLVQLQKRATIQKLVEDGTMVTAGTPEGDITIAVDPQEIVPLTKALELEHGVFAVARSGLPNDTAASAGTAAVKIPEDESPLKNLAVIEKIGPKGRDVEVFVTSFPKPSPRAESSSPTGSTAPASGTAPAAEDPAPQVRKPPIDRQS